MEAKLLVKQLQGKPHQGKKPKINEDSLYLPKNVQMDKMNSFKLQEKKYRLYQGHQTDFSQLIDFNSPNLDLAKHNIEKMSIKGYDVYKLNFPPGTYLVRHCLTVEQQIQIGLKCINDYVRYPYRTNLFIYEDNTQWKDNYGIPTNQMQNGNINNIKKVQEQQKYKQEDEEQKQPQFQQQIQVLHSQMDKSTIITRDVNATQETLPIKTTASHSEEVKEQKEMNVQDQTMDQEKLQKQIVVQKDKYQEELQQDEEDSSSSSIQSSSSLGSSQRSYNVNKYLVQDYSKYYFNKKIRWSNVGSQYDWDNRQYPMLLTPVPQLIKDLACFAQSIMMQEIPDIYNYTPESVIINYYDKKNYMGGHLDDGENDQKSPIFSFCFGLSCVFLMGDRTRDFSPLPLLLESGDMLVMSGYSRNCYHGVPRIVEGSFDSSKFEDYIKQKCPQLEQDLLLNKDLKNFENNEFHVLNYFKENRLNLNFRQVNILQNQPQQNQVQQQIQQTTQQNATIQTQETSQGKENNSQK